MKTRSFTSEQIGEWMATFYQFSTKEEYQNQLHAIRCIFDADNDPDFWDEVCEAAKAKLNK
jgi:hypothetical protein